MERTRGRRWMRIRDAVLDADPLCALCKAEGRTVAAREVDHVVPLHLGGTDDRANLRGLCKAHHRKVTREQEAGRGVVRGCNADGRPLAWGAPPRSLEVGTTDLGNLPLANRFFRGKDTGV